MARRGRRPSGAHSLLRPHADRQPHEDHGLAVPPGRCAPNWPNSTTAQYRAAEILGLFRDWLAGQFRALEAGDAAGEQALHLLRWAQGVAVLAAAFRDEAMIRREVAATERWLDALPYRSPAA